MKYISKTLFNRLRKAMINSDDVFCGGVSENMISDNTKVSNIINNVNNNTKKQKTPKNSSRRATPVWG